MMASRLTPLGDRLIAFIESDATTSA